MPVVPGLGFDPAQKLPKKTTGIPVQLDERQFRYLQLFFGRFSREYHKVITRGINRAIPGARTEVVNQVASEIPVTKKKIRATVSSRKASYRGDAGYVRCSGKPLGLIHFKARPTLKGVTVQMNKQGGRALVPGAFIAQLQGRKNVYWRKKENWEPTRRGPYPGRKYGRHLPQKYRFPVHRLEGPRIPDILERKHVMKRTMTMIGVRVVQAMKHELNRELKGYG